MIPPQTPFLLRNAVTSSGLCGVPLLPKLYKCKRPQHVPEQTYRRISLRRNMLRSSLCFYLVRNATRLHSETSDDCITSITYAISYLFNNKSRSISNTLGKINRIPFLCKAKTLRAFFCNSLSNRPSTLTGFL